MFDINKLPEWKSALDEGFSLEKSILMSGLKKIYIFKDSCFGRGVYCFGVLGKEDIEIIEKDFDVFCKKVSQAILNSQE
jgi:hypothetical protein